MTTNVHFWSCVSFLVRMRNISEKIYLEIQNTYFTFNNFFPENGAVYEIMWKNMITAGQATDDRVWRMRFACWLIKATNTHSEYVILIVFPHSPHFYVTRTLPVLFEFSPHFLLSFAFAVKPGGRDAYAELERRSSTVCLVVKYY
jgi:hypothetical protein